MARGQRPPAARGTGPLPSLDTAAGFEAHRAWERDLVRRPLVGGVVARGVRGPRRRALRVAHLRGGVLPRRRAHPGGPERHLPPGTDPLRVRDPRAEGALPPRHGVGGGDLVPGLVGARRRERPRRHPQPGHSTARARRHGGTWVLNGQKTWCSPRRLRRLGLRAVPLRSRGRAAPGPHLLPGEDGQPGRDGAAHRPARRGDRVRRGLLRGRGGPRRAGARCRGRGLEGGDGDCRLRAGPVVAEPRPLHRGRGRAWSSCTAGRPVPTPHGPPGAPTTWPGP